MSQKFDLTRFVELVKAEHGVVLDIDDPVLVLGTITKACQEELLERVGEARKPLSAADMNALTVLIAARLDKNLLKKRLRKVDWLLALLGSALLILTLGLGDYALRSWVAAGKVMSTAACSRYDPASGGEYYSCTFWTKLP